MLYDLMQNRRGKNKVVMTDTLVKVQDRMKALRNSQRKGIKGDRVVYSIRPAEEAVKFKQKPHSEAWRAGGYSNGPGRVRK